MMFRLEMLTVPVSDVDRAKAFYAEQLAFAVDQDVQVDATHRFVDPTISRNSSRVPRVAPVDRALLPTLVTRPQVDITITFYFRVRVHRPGRTSPDSTALFRPHERQPPWQHHRTTWP